MLNKKIADLLNDQINLEFYSAYLYLEMNNYYADRGLDGFAHWYKVQAHEETEHAMKIYQYLQDEGHRVDLKTIARPEVHFKCDVDVQHQALEHEQLVTRSIDNIVNEAFDEGDYRTMQFLDWFVAEQAEEEVNARDMITKMNLYGSDGLSLYLLNNELHQRE